MLSKQQLLLLVGPSAVLLVAAFSIKLAKTKPVSTSPGRIQQVAISPEVSNSDPSPALIGRLSPFEKQIWDIWLEEWSIQHAELEKRLGRPTGSTASIVLSEFLEQRDEDAQRRGEQSSLRPILIRDAMIRCDEHLHTMQTVALSKDTLLWHIKWLQRWRFTLSRLRTA